MKKVMWISFAVISFSFEIRQRSDDKLKELNRQLETVRKAYDSEIATLKSRLKEQSDKAISLIEQVMLFSGNIVCPFVNDLL